MASKIKVDQIEGSTGSTVTVPTGHTFTITDGLSGTGANLTALNATQLTSGTIPSADRLPTVTVAKGGTNLTSFTAGDILYATGSTTLAKLPKGTAEQVLAMNSGATAPDWGSVDLTVLPTITVAKGGTNLSSFTAGDILYATGSTTLAKLAKGTASQTLKMNSGATAPEWTTVAAGGGLTEIDTWRTTTEQSIGTAWSFTIADYWERCDNAAFEKEGTGMTESSGIFSFPSTGKWYVEFFMRYQKPNVDTVYSYIFATMDNSTWVKQTSHQMRTISSNTLAMPACTAIMNVDSTTNCKVKFMAERVGYSGLDVHGDTAKNLTYANFIKLA